MTPTWRLQILFLAAISSLGASSILKDSFLRRNVAGGCAPLSNRGSHFTVELQVGSPPQTFSVVADTGSDAVIVPSCLCQQQGVCSKRDRCFTGTNRSSSFLIAKSPPEVMITFGSGPIQAVVASDIVRVGGVNANMTDGVLLMINQQLNFAASSFEGILGLGIPKNATRSLQQPVNPQANQMPTNPIDALRHILGLDKPGGPPSGTADPPKIGTAQTSDYDDQDMIKKIMGFAMSRGPPGLDTPAAPRNPPSGTAAPPKIGASPDTANPDESQVQIQQRSFLKTAGIERFALCFNEGKDGVLRMGLPKSEQALGSLGQAHWGLGFKGMSVGSQQAPVKFCDDSSKTPEQKTACGAIPDSGTTLITGPPNQVLTLLDEICENWSRCKNNYTSLENATAAAKKAVVDAYHVDPFDLTVMRKAWVLKQVLKDCGRWINEPGALKELPSLHLHLEGAGGKLQTLELSPWAYIIETQIKGNSSLPVNGSKECSAAFGALDYNTKENGPVWILGTSLFYEYNVEYDLGATPPSMSFTSLKQSPCGQCSGGAASFADSASSEALFPRKMKGPIRAPEIDTTLPL